MLFLKAFQGISKFVIFNHEEVPSLQSVAFLARFLATAGKDFEKDPKPDSVTPQRIFRRS